MEHLTEQELAALRTENAALRERVRELESQVIPWRDGGARGGDYSDLSIEELYLLVCDDQVFVSPLHLGKLTKPTEELLFISDAGDWVQWSEVDFICLLSDFPMPKNPVAQGVYLSNSNAGKLSLGHWTRETDSSTRRTGALQGEDVHVSVDLWNRRWRVSAVDLNLPDALTKTRYETPEDAKSAVDQYLATLPNAWAVGVTHEFKP